MITTHNNSIGRNRSPMQRLAASGERLSVRAVMMLLLWQGPIPWCHSHDALRASKSGSLMSAAAEKFDLASHLKKHHRDIDPRSRISLGWHIHWVLPLMNYDPLLGESSPNEGIPQPPVSIHADRYFAYGTNLLQAFDQIHAVEFANFVTPSPHLSNDGANSLTSHFYDEFSTSLSLPQRFSVYRC